MKQTIRLYNHQQSHPVDLPWLRRIVKAALPHCMDAAKSVDAPLLHVPEVEISLISDDEITRVHAEFLDDPTPTDVITFHHGEILVSTDTAFRQGTEHQQPLNRELALYMIHGLMHLGGWDDHEASEAAQMAAHQQRILDLVAG